MAIASRTIETLTADGFTVNGGTLVRWSSAPRPELLSAWGLTKALLGKDALPAGNPLHLSAQDLAIHLADCHGGSGSFVVGHVAPKVATAPEPVTAPKAPKVAEPVTVSAGYADPVMTALAEFVKVTAAASVDEDRVKALIDEALQGLPKGHGGTVINVPTRPEPVTLSGVVHEEFDKLLTAVSFGLAVYLYGPPATGKSHAAEAVAEAMGVPLVGILACSPDMMPSAVRGFVDAGGTYQRTAFRDAYEHGGVFVIDEIDNAPSAITVGLVNTALASSRMTFPDGTIAKSPNFRLVVTANTFGTGATAEFVGRFPLDPSTLSRFVRIGWNYSERVDRAVVEGSGAVPRIVDGVMSAVSRMRENVATAGLRSFITSRDAKAAALMLTAGWTWEDVLNACLVPAGTTDDQRRQILNNVRPVSA